MSELPDCWPVPAGWLNERKRIMRDFALPMRHEIHSSLRGFAMVFKRCGQKSAKSEQLRCFNGLIAGKMTPPTVFSAHRGSCATREYHTSACEAGVSNALFRDEQPPRLVPPRFHSPPQEHEGFRPVLCRPAYPEGSRD